MGGAFPGGRVDLGAGWPGSAAGGSGPGLVEPRYGALRMESHRTESDLRRDRAHRLRFPVAGRPAGQGQSTVSAAGGHPVRHRPRRLLAARRRFYARSARWTPGLQLQRADEHPGRRQSAQGIDSALPVGYRGANLARRHADRLPFTVLGLARVPACFRRAAIRLVGDERRWVGPHAGRRQEPDRTRGPAVVEGRAVALLHGRARLRHRPGRTQNSQPIHHPCPPHHPPIHWLANNTPPSGSIPKPPSHDSPPCRFRCIAGKATTSPASSRPFPNSAAGWR